MLPIVQMASITGVYGVSALLAATATAAAYFVVERGRARFVVAAGTVVAVGLCAAWGAGRLRTASSLLTQGTPVRVAVLQGNIPQDQKWDPAMRDAIMERYIDMTREAIGRNAQFILWPESATPVHVEEDIVRG